MGGGDSESLLMSLIPNNYPKPDLFLFKRNEVDNNPIDVTNYKIDDLINLVDEEESELCIICLYESSNLSTPIVGGVKFTHDSRINLVAYVVYQKISTNEVVYNNKTYFYAEIVME